MKNTDGEHFYTNTGAQAAQIKPTAAESFQKQIKKTSAVKNITYHDTTQNQTQSKEHWDEEIQQHLDVEKKSINTIKNQLIEFYQKQPEQFSQIKNHLYHLNLIKTFKNGDETPVS